MPGDAATPKSSPTKRGHRGRVIVGRWGYTVPEQAIYFPDASDPWIQRGFLSIEIRTVELSTYERACRAETERPYVEPVERCELQLDMAALAAYTIAPGERVERQAAEWLWTVREYAEPRGVVASSSWCVTCGLGVVDARGKVPRVRAYCDKCRHGRRRYSLRCCAAADCHYEFWPRRADQEFCSEACAKAERRRAA